MTGLAFLAGRDGLPAMAWHEWRNDFDDYSASEWVITETGSGTRDVADARGGVLVITNGASDNDKNTLQWSGLTDGSVAETFAFQADKRAYFGIRCKLSDATEADFWAGLIVTDTDLVGGIADGIFFRKDDGDDDLDFIVTGSSTSTGSPTGIKDLADDTWYILEWYYDGNGHFTAFVDGIAVASVASTNAPSTELAVTFGIQNGTDAAKALHVDWIRVIEER